MGEVVSLVVDLLFKVCWFTLVYYDDVKTNLVFINNQSCTVYLFITELNKLKACSFLS